MQYKKRIMISKKNLPFSKHSHKLNIKSLEINKNKFFKPKLKYKN